MSTVPKRQSYLDAPYGIASWLLTKDHKRIAMLYLISITIFFAIGGLFALGIRLELITPKGDLLTADTYNKMFTLHGVIMIFFFLIPSIPATLGNFLIPIMCGTKDLAFPRINLLSWYLYVIGAALTLGLAVFDPKIGGDPVLFQHLFWFYSHPAVYIMILPGMGVMSELVAAISRKQVFGYGFVAFSSLAIAVIGFLVWGHHLFVSSQSAYAGMVFSIISYLVAVPSAVKTFNWTATLYKGSISYQTPMLYAFGFIGLFLVGGLTGLFLAAVGLDVHVHDTYFVVAHFHYIMVGGTLMAYLGGLHYWWPKITGRLYPEGWSKLSALVIFLGFNLTFFPQFIVGYLGMPRRYAVYPPEFQVLNVMSSAGASILAIGYLLPAIYFTYSLVKGVAAPANPWGAKGLEWTTSSPPPTFNFDRTPVVTEATHMYGHPEEVKVV